MVEDGKMRLTGRMIYGLGGYGKADSHVGSHVRPDGHDGIISTMTCLVHFNKVVVEVWEDNEEENKEENKEEKE